MRYFKATLVIGLLSTALVATLHFTGWLRTAEVMTSAGLTRLGPDGAVRDAGAIAGLVAGLVAAFAFAWTTVDLARPAAKFGIAFIGGVLLVTGSLVAALYGWFVSPFPAVLATLFSYGLGLVYGRSRGGSRKRVLRRLFGQRLSARQFNRLVDSSLPLDLPGAELNATVVCCEVHNHVPLLETLSPEDYVAMTNLYLKTASDYLVDVGGYLDECNGESLRVVFGAPLEREDHAVAACRAAVELSARIDALNKECDARWHQRLDFRVGINSGPMIAAAYGGTRLGSFSVAGPVVEFARRLCAAGANYGCRILVGAETYAEAHEKFDARPIELLRRPNGSRIELYEVLAPAGTLSPERARGREHFWKGVIYARDRKWDLAMEEFTRARVPGIPDPALDAIVLRTERERRGEHPREPATVAALAEIQ